MSLQKRFHVMAWQLSAIAILISAATLCADEKSASEPGLIGYWKLRGDCLDSSGLGNNGVNHGVDLKEGKFSGRGEYIEVPNSPSLQLGVGDISISAWVNAAPNVTDVPGDLVTKFYSSTHRRGFSLSLVGNMSGYNGPGDQRQLFFGLDNGTAGKWTDCGRPNGQTHVCDAATVFKGELYVGTTDAPNENDWAHVYRYRGGQTWEDLGRVGSRRTRGVTAMVVHDGDLYVATSACHNKQPADIDFGRAYRYRGGQTWEEIGQPGECVHIFGMASYAGKLYVAAYSDRHPSHVYAYEGNQQWRDTGEFEDHAHALTVNDGKLYMTFPKGQIFAYDGDHWENLGNPFNSFAICNQIHCMGVHRGELYAGCWPTGRVAVLRDGQWIDLGRLCDATEIVGLVSYNGSLYAGTIPRADVLRFDGPDNWISIRRLFDPPGFVPVPIRPVKPQVQDWTRASSLTVYQGRLFVTTASCYRRFIPEPLPDDSRGKVFSYSAGAAVSHDHDLGTGWKQVVAVRKGNRLTLSVDGQQTVSTEVDGDLIDVSNEAPLQLGFGPQSHFHGQMREVRLYNRALSPDEIQSRYKQESSQLKLAD
jgi:hypothetical protein